MKKQNKKNTSGLPQLVRKVNLQAVIREMRRTEIFSKIDLARLSGISTTTMTKLFAQLEEDHLIVLSPKIDKTFGRPKTLFQLSPALQIAAIVIDVDQTTISFSNLQGEVLDNQSVSFSTGSNPQELFSQIATEFAQLQKKLKAPCRLVGICIPGLIEFETGRSMLNPNIPWLEGLSPAKEVQRVLGIETVIMHEEMALCRAQLRATDDSSDYISMDFSSGVGMSVISNGEALFGTSGFAGEIGHIIMEPNGKLCGCGNRGCLETIASDRVFQTAAGLPMKEAMRKLAAEEPEITAIAERVLQAQATGISAVINIFNPEKIFVYSCLSEAMPSYLEKLREAIRQRTLSVSFNQCTIDTTHDGKLKGALLLTIDSLINLATTPKNQG